MDYDGVLPAKRVEHESDRIHGDCLDATLVVDWNWTGWGIVLFPDPLQAMVLYFAIRNLCRFPFFPCAVGVYAVPLISVCEQWQMNFDVMEKTNQSLFCSCLSRSFEKIFEVINFASLQWSKYVKSWFRRRC